MVDAINGSGKTIIITTKPKAKVEKKSTSFDDAMKGRTEGTSRGESLNQPILSRGNLDHNMRLLQQQQMARAQHVQEITRQIQDGTYQMCDPAVLAEKIFHNLAEK